MATARWRWTSSIKADVLTTLQQALLSATDAEPTLRPSSESCFNWSCVETNVGEICSQTGCCAYGFPSGLNQLNWTELNNPLTDLPGNCGQCQSSVSQWAANSCCGIPEPRQLTRSENWLVPEIHTCDTAESRPSAPSARDTTGSWLQLFGQSTSTPPSLPLSLSLFAFVLSHSPPADRKALLIWSRRQTAKSDSSISQMTRKT